MKPPANQLHHNNGEDAPIDNLLAEQQFVADRFTSLWAETPLPRADRQNTEAVADGESCRRVEALVSDAEATDIIAPEKYLA